mgnify:CR=1 FL=1
MLITFANMLFQMAPYLLLGFMMAGVLHVFVPSNFFERYLAKENFRSVLLAGLIGVPLPLCSCGVIPTAISLRKDGASRGATVAFMVFVFLRFKVIVFSLVVIPVTLTSVAVCSFALHSK